MMKCRVTERATLTVEPGSVVLVSDGQYRAARAHLELQGERYGGAERAAYLPEDLPRAPESGGVIYGTPDSVTAAGGGVRGRPRKNP